jgi:hypothetical protein
MIAFCVCPPCLYFSEFHILRPQYCIIIIIIIIIILAPFPQIFCSDIVFQQTKPFMYCPPTASNLLSICTYLQCRSLTTVHLESRCALRSRYVDLVVSIKVAVEVCFCFTVFSC